MDAPQPARPRGANGLREAAAGGCAARTLLYWSSAAGRAELGEQRGTRPACMMGRVAFYPNAL